MAIKKVFFEFDPFELVGVDKPSSNVRDAKLEIADFVLDEVLTFVGGGKSPVRNGKWKRSLNKDYKKFKKKFSSSLFANMELRGDLLDDLEVIINPRGNLELRVMGKEAPKADGHNNHSGQSKLPAREFIPKKDGTFKKSILQGMKDIAEEFMDGEEEG